MQIEELMDNVSKVRDNANYWMIRTESGSYFETFLENDFVAIGWNTVTVADMKDPKKEDRVRNIISSLEQIDPSTPRGKGSITTIYNKIQNFIELKKGDIVMIPGPSSHELAFGLIDDHQVYVENDQLCEHRKRRKVKWLEKKEKTKLDPIFYKMKVSRHALTNLDLYSNYIDAVINTVFIKENHAHFVIDFKKAGDINIDTLLGLMSNLRKLSIKINDAFEFGDPMDHQSIRLNLQSPGHAELKQQIGKSMIMLATIISLYCCNPQEHSGITSDAPPKVRNFIEQEKDTINAVEAAMIELEANFEKLKDVAYGTR